MRVFVLTVALACLCSPGAIAEVCIASVYAIGDSSQPGTKTASGIPLNNGALTAAHKALPLRSRARVTNSNGRSVVVTITDRGPYVRGRCIDLTRASARVIGISGLGRVNVEPLR